ncbi:MAG: hypothetical protein D6677_06725 [Calditrichaeota bacterium]|nr:MAG: hypothetical protein D6677_06725 [Calditrichota bacterium]
MSHGVIFDKDNNQLIINGSNTDVLLTSAYTLDLEPVWQQEFRLDNLGSPLTYALAQNQAGHYISFGYFVDYGVMRLEYAPTGVAVDTTNIGRYTIRDAKPSPVHDVIVVRKDLNFGDRVAVHVPNEWYIATQGGEVRFFDMNTKAEILELRRGY